MKNIVLIGMSGVGKTTIGQALSRTLNKEFIDMDNVISQELGISIEEIFSLHGEDYFRGLEREFVQEIYNKEDKIISTGGGIVLNQDNMVKLRENGIIILLYGSVETLTRNILGSTQVRPLLKDKENIRINIESIYNMRKQLYLFNCDYSISVDNKNIDKIIYEILDKCVKINS